jgi:hypothetical protein
VAIEALTRENARRWRLTFTALGAAIVIVGLLTGLLAVIHQRSDQGGPASADQNPGIGPGASRLPATPTSFTVPTTVVTPGITTPDSSPTTTATTVAAATSPGIPAQLVVNLASVEFGRTSTTRYLTISNAGGSPMDFTATASNPLLSISPSAGTVQPGGVTTFTVVFDRAKAPVGPFSGFVTLTTPSGSATVPATAVVPDPGPTITHPRFSQADCTVSATITGATRAWVTWVVNKQVDMKPSGDGTTWATPALTVSAPGDVTWSITAVDGNSTKMTPDHTDTISQTCKSPQ